MPDENDYWQRAPWRQYSRRSLLRGFGLGASSLLLAACSSKSGGASSSSGTAAKAGASASPAANLQEWNDLIAAAKKEGKLVIGSGPDPNVREGLPPAFKKQFGIDMEYIGGPSSQLATRLKNEQASGLYTVDVLAGGADTSYQQYYGGKLIQPLRPLLIHPDVLDPTKWKPGKVWFRDPEGQYQVQSSQQLGLQITLSPNSIKPAELTSWNDLLKPQYRGKIGADDPVSIGAGSQNSVYFQNTLGSDFVKGLYVDQKPGLTRDDRQFSDWVARGTYPIAVGLAADYIEQVKADGFKVEVLNAFKEAPGWLSGGFGIISVAKNAPHPNAAKLFVNWVLLPEGQTVYNSLWKTASIRTDVKSTWVPDYVVPKPGVNYLDVYDYDYVVNRYVPAFEKVKAIMAQR